MLDARYLRQALPVVIDTLRDATVARISCSACPKKEEWRLNSRMPGASILHKHFARRGWTVKRRPLCEVCQALKRKPTMPQENSKLTVSDNIRANKVATESLRGVEQSDAAREAKRMVMTELEQRYDDRTKFYRPGYSDATVAQVTGVAPAVVAKIREEFFGPLREPDEVGVLRQELADMAEQLAAYRDRFAAMALRFGWKAD